MGLKDIFRRWTSRGDARAVERAEAESRMTPLERERDQEDFSARRADAIAELMYPGAAAEDAAEDELESR